MYLVDKMAFGTNSIKQGLSRGERENANRERSNTALKCVSRRVYARVALRHKTTESYDLRPVSYSYDA